MERDFTNKLCAALMVMDVPPALAKLASERMMSGYKTYGPGEWLRVGRDLKRDTDEELADALTYIAMRAFKEGPDRRFRQAIYHLSNVWETLNAVDRQRGNDS